MLLCRISLISKYWLLRQCTFDLLYKSYFRSYSKHDLTVLDLPDESVMSEHQTGPRCRRITHKKRHTRFQAAMYLYYTPTMPWGWDSTDNPVAATAESDFRTVRQRLPKIDVLFAELGGLLRQCSICRISQKTVFDDVPFFYEVRSFPKVTKKTDE